ncbi:PepSY-associated TM helix domain-containing protein [Methyloterricola oryzae]|uniref:PepSY-associated TM helix domain-containing protein n=1 Tax=Methyloterricola oryzae TaxID=1495050 RepID=UPI0005EB1FA8|nr:PepSY-associated TM helix domain-containing protein [Methyloterricola oryzae]
MVSIAHRHSPEDFGAARLARLKARRRVWLQVHLWLGLTAGAVLALIGLTGSVLVFWQELDAWLSPGQFRVSAPAESASYRPLDEIVAAARTGAPPGAEPGFVYYPEGPEDVFTFFFDKPGATVGESDTLNVSVNPYTARVTGTRVFYSGTSYFDNCLMGFIFKLHYALLWKEGGVVLVGGIGVLLVVSVLSGLILWWPLTGQWLNALTIKRRASAERFNFDLHKTFGFYSTLVLLAVLVSGVYMNLPEQVVWLVERVSKVNPLDEFHSTVLTGSTPIGLGRAVENARASYPLGRLRFLNLPSSPEGVYQICGQGGDELARYVLDTRCVSIDQYTGAVLQVTDPAHGSGGDVFIQWQWPLHSGQAFGMTGRLLVFASGLACPVLFVTGIIRWRQKKRAARAGIERRQTRQAAGAMP